MTGCEYLISSGCIFIYRKHCRGRREMQIMYREIDNLLKIQQRNRGRVEAVASLVLHTIVRYQSPYNKRFRKYYRFTTFQKNLPHSTPTGLRPNLAAHEWSSLICTMSNKPCRKQPRLHMCNLHGSRLSRDFRSGLISDCMKHLGAEAEISLVRHSSFIALRCARQLRRTTSPFVAYVAAAKSSVSTQV